MIRFRAPLEGMELRQSSVDHLMRFGSILGLSLRLAILEGVGSMKATLQPSLASCSGG